ncbi:MAG: radical SAM protein [Clostridiales Family XIII bacterium]|jgi:radical SAM superfamily enzyme YgiQ (UPF0313 family)|nr:radical SAM protein [Clostridiales Family XIII bacterium]
MKILFILPYDNTYHRRGNFTRSLSYAPLTLATLAALVPAELNADITIIDEGVDEPLTEGDFDIVAVTCVTSSAKRAYSLCRYWKEKGSYTILGGSHPTLMPDEANGFADSVFIGLAEKTFPQFFEDFTKGTPKPVYRAEQKCGLLSMPTPHRDLLSKEYMKIPTVIANRGCHNNCSFCSIPRLYGNDGFARPIGEFIEEVKSLKQKRYILLDPNLSSNREYAIELFKTLAPLKVKWGGLTTIDVAEDIELFDLMVKSGCGGILAGFESVNDDSLKGVGKNTNQVSKYKQAVSKFHGAGIPVLGCFVLGFDNDTVESLYDMVEVIDEIGIDVPRFSILTPFPNTSLFEQYDRQNRIITKDWDKYDTMHVVFEPKNMTPQELQQTFYDVWQKAYKTKRIMRRGHNSKRNIFLNLLTNIGFKYYARRLPNA